jgi:TPR repeat protein
MNSLFKSMILVGVASLSASGQTPAHWLEQAEADVARGDYQAANSIAEAVRNKVGSGNFDRAQVRPIVLRIAEIKSLAGKFGEADEIVRKMQALFKPLTPLESVRTQIVLAVSEAETGNLVGAQAAAQGAVEAAKGPGVDDVWTANAQAELADVLLQEGKLVEARELAALVRAAARQNLNSPSLSAKALTIFADVALVDGRPEGARLWVYTVQNARSWEATHQEAMMLREIEARVELAEENSGQAADSMNSVIALAQKGLGSANAFVARCLLTLAKAEIREGKWQEADDALASAAALVDVPNTRVDLRLEWMLSSAEAFVQLHRDNDAKLMLSRAKALASQYGLELPRRPESPKKEDAAALVARADQMLTAKDYAGALLLYRQATDLGSAKAMTNIGFLYDHGLGVAKDYGQAMEWFRTAADLGEATAMKNIGGLYQNGRGVAQDYGQAMQWYRKAADLGSSQAANSVGILYEKGHGVGQDYTQAMQWYRKAADLGSPPAMTNIGFLFENGFGLARDYGEAMQWYHKAADLGNSLAMNDIGALYGTGHGVTRDYGQAMQWYRKAADLGESLAMTNIGFLYENGFGVAQDYGQAIQWYHKAADLGNSQAVNNVGVLYEKGHGVGQDYAQAMQWYRKAADLGNALAMNNIGLQFQNGHLVAQDYGQAMEWYRKAAGLGNPNAMTNIGFLYDHGYGAPQDFGRAMEWFRKAAEIGEATAMIDVGFLYQNGRGVPQDYGQAMQWYRKAADLGNTGAMIDIGVLYENGRGVAQDYGQAMEWFRKAADLGNSQAMVNIGFFYQNGRGVPQDYAQAMQWFRKAADLGTAGAMINIGLFYQNGRGVTRDSVQAMEWYRKAADLGNASAMKNVGGLYESGLGVPQDRAQAIFWYRKAAALGNQLSKDALKRLGADLADAASAGPRPAGTTGLESPPMNAGGKAMEAQSQPEPPLYPPAGTTRRNPKDGLTYLFIPPGSFSMGCSPGDGECFGNEFPLHVVTITKGFWMGQTAVPQGAYERVTGSNPSQFKGENLPAESTWEEAMGYCEAAGARLPTEAEWEYAARAGGREGRYGDLDAIAWYVGNSGGRTHAVGQKQANAWKLYDMLGNVYQWTADWYAAYSGGRATDPQGAPAGAYRVLRGGSRDDPQRYIRVSYRLFVSPTLRFYTNGFRCLSEVP